MHKTIYIPFFLLALIAAGCSSSEPDRELFSMDVSRQDELNQEVAGEELRRDFREKGVELSPQTEVQTQLESKEWVISDKEQKKEYLVVQEDNKLKVTEQRIDFEAIKADRRGFDSVAQKDEAVFGEYDHLLKRWEVAQKEEKYGEAGALSRELKDRARENFTVISDALEKGEPSQKLIASAMLGFSDDVRSLPYLLDALKKGEPDLRGNSALGIGQIGFGALPREASERTVRALVASLRTEPDDDVRAMVAFAISQAVARKEDFGSLPALLESLRDSSFKVRNNAVVALGKIRHLEGAGAIAANTLKDPNPGVRYSSIRSLGQIAKEGADVSKDLVGMLRDSSPIVAGAAYHVLKNVSGEDFGPEAARWEEWAGIATERKSQ